MTTEEQKRLSKAYDFEKRIATLCREFATERIAAGAPAAVINSDLVFGFSRGLGACLVNLAERNEDGLFHTVRNIAQYTKRQLQEVV